MRKGVLLIAALAVSALTMSSVAQEKYKEIKGLTSPEGKEITLSEVVKINKYTLLDFWATWCPPCRAEIPYMQEAYSEYKDKGFEIYGVSYDNDGEAWRKFIADTPLPWIHVSVLRGWDCPTKELYGIRGIPTNHLIDKEGNIVASNLRGEALAATLKELLK